MARLRIVVCAEPVLSAMLWSVFELWIWAVFVTKELLVVAALTATWKDTDPELGLARLPRSHVRSVAFWLTVHPPVQLPGTYDRVPPENVGMASESWLPVA